MTRGALRAISTVVATLALAAGAVACGDEPAATPKEATRATLILDWFPNADHAGVYGALDEGFFEKAGVKVTPQVPSDPTASLKQVATGKADFAISYEADVLLARSEGIPVTAVAALVTAPLNSVIARADRGISRPRDLEGKTVGIAGVPSDRPLLDTVVRADGGDPAKVATRTVGFTLAPSLAGGKVDAVTGAYWNVEAVELRQKGVDVNVFRLDEHGVPDYDELVIVTSDATADTRPELVRAFLAGLAEGQAWAAANPAEAVRHLLAANKDLDPALVTEGVRLVAPLLDPSDAEPLAFDPAAWARYAEWMRTNDLLRKKVDVGAAARSEFLPAK